MACPIMVIFVITLHVLDVRSERTCTELVAHRSSFVQFGATWADWCCLVQLGPIGAAWCNLVQIGAVCWKLVLKLRLGDFWWIRVQFGATWADWCNLVLIAAVW